MTVGEIAGVPFATRPGRHGQRPRRWCLVCGESVRTRSPMRLATWASWHAAGHLEAAA